MISSIFVSLFVAFMIAYFVKRLRREIKMPKIGKLSRVAFYSKFLASWSYFWLQKKLSPRKSLKLPLEEYTQAMFITDQEWKIENPQQTSNAFDHIQFSGFDSDGNTLHIDLEANKKVEVMLKLDGVMYRLEQSGDIVQEQGETWFSAGGLRLENREPFRRWKINFKGYLTSDAENRERTFVTISAWWAAISEVYDFWDDTPISQFARAAAVSGSFKDTVLFLQRVRQCHHYHQFGQIFGKIFVDGVTESEKEMLFRGPKIREFGDLHLTQEAEWTKTSNMYFQDGTCIHLVIADAVNYEALVANAWMVLPKGEISAIKWFDDRIFASTTAESVSVRTGTLLEVLVNNGGKTLYSVPGGICLTTSAYDKHIQNLGGKVGLDDLESQKKLNKAGVNEIAATLAHLINDGEFSTDLRTDINAELARQYDQAWEQKAFAVRSSAVGEDSSELSTAGQLETFLYLSGLDEICTAVKKCWSSNFREEVVEYRRQHGQSLVTSVAVVIQEMIDPDIAGIKGHYMRHVYLFRNAKKTLFQNIEGVLFTQDPVSGNPEKIIVNASPGCGESVVSGEVNPDTVVIARRSKHQMTITERQSGSGKSASDICLSDELALKLSAVGVSLEENLDNTPQDIEWAIKDSRLYILQSRAITSLEVESEWELLHEFDTGNTAETDWHTTANVGNDVCCTKMLKFVPSYVYGIRLDFREVLPEGMTPMAISFPILDGMQQYWMGRSNGQVYVQKHFKAGFQIYRNRFFMNILRSFYQDGGSMEDTTVQEISFLGHVLEDKRVKAESVYRYPFPGWLIVASKIKFMLKGTFYDGGVARRHAEEAYANFKLPIHQSEDPLEIYDMIEQNINHWSKTWLDHMYTSMASSISYAIVGTFRKTGAEWTPEVIGDIATIYADCQNLVSAEIPEDLKKIALAIAETDNDDTFMSMETDKALEWLQTSECGEAGEAYADFMKKHGHRCPCEIDVGSVAWWQDPGQLVESVKGLLRHKESITARLRTSKTVDDTLNSLKSPMGPVSRALLKWAIPKVRNAVASRETTKGLAIGVTDQFKRAFLKIGTLLSHKGYLPEPQLIFFLTFPEVKELIDNRSGRLVSRAVRRRKLMPLQNACVYPEMIHGHPKPVEKDENFVVSKVIKGTGVCLGCVQGTARVAHTLKDAKETKPGEILITRSTDISWSPYFPIISGLVTELGGLLSHGAVVAREYGLPCLIGAANALDSFETGDLVILDTTKGIIEKIEK